MKYYVYAYLREDRYTPYYIGKGQAKRAYQNGGRNCYKPPKDRISIVYRTDDEEEALEVERTLILFWGKDVLKNISDGGNQPPNMTGYKRPDTTKYKEAARRYESWRRWKGGGAKKGNHNRKPHPVLVDGVIYPHAGAAAEVLGITRQAVMYRVKIGRYSYA